MSYGSQSNVLITEAEVKGIVAQTSTAMVSLTCIGEAKVRKTGNPFDAVFKVSRIQGIINADYENAVNNQRAREGKPADFAAQSTWFHHVSGALVEHNTNGTQYIAILAQGHAESRYVGMVGETLRELTDDEVKSFVPEKGASVKQELDKEVAFRVVRMDSLAGIKFDGTDRLVVNGNRAFNEKVLELVNIR